MLYLMNHREVVRYQSYHDHIISTISYHDQIPAASQPLSIDFQFLRQYP